MVIGLTNQLLVMLFCRDGLTWTMVYEKMFVLYIIARLLYEGCHLFVVSSFLE